MVLHASVGRRWRKSYYLVIALLIIILFSCFRLVSFDTLGQYGKDFVETILSSSSSLITHESEEGPGDDSCMEKLHLCQRPRVYFPPYLQDLNPIFTPNNTNANETYIINLEDRPWWTSMRMSYQCGGEDYYKFGQKLLRLHKERIKSQPWWGYRPTPIPGANKRILVLGNSHTRQKLETLFCQYNHLIQSGRMFGEPNKHRIGNEGIVVFPNNNTIRWHLNGGQVYAGSAKWKNLTQDYLGELLDDFDLLVVGRFNRKQQSHGTSFYQDMLEAQRENPDINIESNAPPSLVQIANVYSGPILQIGSFDAMATQFTKQFLLELDYLNNEAGRTNVAVLDARQYIPNLGECGAEQKYSANQCLGAKGKNCHRCQGAYGGLPDPAVWDIVEHFYKHP